MLIADFGAWLLKYVVTLTLGASYGEGILRVSIAAFTSFHRLSHVLAVVACVLASARTLSLDNPQEDVNPPAVFPTVAVDRMGRMIIVSAVSRTSPLDFRMLDSIEAVYE